MQPAPPADKALPPPPPLEENFLRAERVRADGVGELEVLLPAGEPYAGAPENAPAVVMVPGLGMDGLGFIRQLPLAVIADLHLFQTPNEAYPGEEGLGSFARYAEEYIKARKLEERPGGVVIAGCSMGGAVSLAVAIRARVKLRGLILMGTFGNAAHVRWSLRAFGPALSHVLPLGLSRHVARLVVGRTHYFGKVKPAEADWLVSCKLDRDRGYYVRAAACLTRQNQIEAARQLKLPTLVLHGTKDHVLPYSAGQELAAAIPGARLVTLQDTGHALFFTDYETVNGEIAKFLGAL